MTGATGLIGRQVCLKLLENNHELVVISTRDEASFRESFSYPCEYHHWNQLTQLPKVDAVIHLAGENIADGRWSEKKKTSILDSRINPTQKLLNAFESNNQWPKTFISTSAIGYYGNRGDEFLSEEAKPEQGFLADVCKAWESSVFAIEKYSRLVILRVGIVLDIKGGFLNQLEPLFTANLGGKVGHGKQWMSWIHIRDLVNMYIHCLNNESIVGPFNAVAPEPVTNAHFTKVYAKQLKVMSFFTAPALALKIGLGEMSQLALASQNVRADKIQQSGFSFLFNNIADAFSDLYQWKTKTNQQIFFSEQWVSQPRSKVFPFFSEAKNLEKITPPFLNFKILKSSDQTIDKGTLIDYKLKIHGFPARWRTEIEDWQPNALFIDNQLKGPYKMWRHTHRFVELKNGTLIKDQVIYELPLGKLGLFTAGAFVRKDIQMIFSYRTKIIHQMDGSL